MEAQSRVLNSEGFQIDKQENKQIVDANVNSNVFIVATSILAMKCDKDHDKARNASIHLVPVCFEFTHPTATTVCLAGTFNNWKPESRILHSPSTGRWWKEMTLAPGAYEYCLVVDGQWMPDPLVRETVPNPFGGRNSVLRVGRSSEAAHLADAESLPFCTDSERKI
jgi:hypothetical protein